MKFVAYELRKLAGVRYVRILLIILLIANALLCYSTTAPKGIDSKIVSEFFDLYLEDPAAMETSYAELCELQNERDAAYRLAMHEGNYDYEPDPIPNKLALADRAGVSDGELYGALFSRLHQIESYPSEMQRIIDVAESNLAEFAAMGMSENSYTYRYQERVISHYEHMRDNVTIELEYTRGWDVYFDYTAVNIFLFAFLILCGTVIFSQERSCGFLPIIRSTELGRRTTALAKIAAMSVVTIVALLLFTLTTFAVVGIRCGYSSPTNAIQAFSRFTLSPYLLSVGRYFVVTILVKAIAFSLFSSLVLLFSLLFSDFVLSYACSLGFFGINFLLYTLSYINADNPFKNLNLVATAAVNPLFVRYRSINFFGAVIGYLPFMICTFLLLFLLVSALTVRRFSTETRAVRPISFGAPIEALRRFIGAHPAKTRQLPQKTHCRMYSLFAFECHKTLISSRLLMLTLLLLIAKCLIASEAYAPSVSYSDTIYREYMTTLAGPITAEKRAYIAEERERISSILAKKASTQEAYLTEQISFSEYAEYLDRYNDAYGRDGLFSSIEEHLRYIDRLAEQGIEADFVYDTGWRKLFETPFDYTLFAALLILFAGNFASEYTGKSSSGSFSSILRSTKFGRRQTFSAKMLSCMLIAGITTAVWGLVDLLFIGRAYSLPEMVSPLQSIELFADYKGSLSIVGGLLLVCAMRTLASITLSVALSALSCLLRRTLPAISLTAALTLFPALLLYFGFSLFERFDYTSYLRTTPYFLLSARESGNIGFLLLFAGGAAAIAAALTGGAAKRWNR